MSPRKAAVEAARLAGESTATAPDFQRNVPDPMWSEAPDRGEPAVCFPNYAWRKAQGSICPACNLPSEGRRYEYRCSGDAGWYHLPCLPPERHVIPRAATRAEMPRPDGKHQPALPTQADLRTLAAAVDPEHKNHAPRFQLELSLNLPSKYPAGKFPAALQGSLR